MKEKSKKIVLIVLALFLGSFFLCNNALAETGDKGVIIERFEYDENDELVLSWSVDAGYSEWQVQEIFNIYGSYGTPLSAIYVDQNTEYPSLNVLMNYNESWGNLFFIYDLIDCYEVTEFGKRQNIYADDFGSKTCSMKFTSFGYYPIDPVYPASGIYVKKSDIDTGFYTTDFLENISWNYQGNYPWQFQNIYGGYGTYVYNDPTQPNYPFTASTTFPILGTPIPIDGVCGSVNGSTFDWADFDNQDFCSAGDFYLSGDNGERIIYACVGLNGGTTQYNCSASYYYNGVCGPASGSSFSSLDVSNTGLCSSGYVSESSFLESGSGWTWVCSGSGSSSFCNATKSLISFPETPEETDCSSLTFPDNLLCNIENLLKTGFLPSASAINNLNNAVNQVQQKAPFNYLNVAIEKISNIKDDIASESISMSLMGNSSTLNINSFTSDFMPSVKSFFTLMIVFGFIFWGIAYIKHFFK